MKILYEECTKRELRMKLTKILALAIAMATMATAQNSGANGQTKPTPSPTPAVAGKTGGAAQAGTKNAGQQPAAKTGTGTPAKATNTKAAATKTGATATGATPQGGATSGAPAKPVIKTTTTPVKAQTTAAPSPKGAPTPVVAAKGSAKPADTKKTEAKKPDTKKGATAKPPSVIAVKPTEGTKKKAASAQAKPPAKPAAPKVTQAAPAPKPAEKPKATARSFGPRGRRDPFVSPIVKEGVNAPKPNCTSGKRCLVIPELVLQGTVKDTSGKMMAVVANSVKKTYFLRENDQVFQGSVEKITSDSIIFREYIKDALGRETAREVVKKLVPTS